MDDNPWDDLVDELTLTTPATFARAFAWVALGRELGWTLEETREHVSDFIARGMHPREIRAAMEVTAAARRGEAQKAAAAIRLLNHSG